MKGKNKLVPRLLGVTKDSVMRVDEKTKEVLQEWPLTTVKRWAASPKSFTLVILLCVFRDLCARGLRTVSVLWLVPSLILQPDPHWVLRNKLAHAAVQVQAVVWCFWTGQFLRRKLPANHCLNLICA